MRPLKNLALFISCGSWKRPDRADHARAGRSVQAYVAERAKPEDLPEFFTSWRDNNAGTGNVIAGSVPVIRRGLRIRRRSPCARISTLMLEGSCDIYSLSKMMGHSNVSDDLLAAS